MFQLTMSGGTNLAVPDVCKTPVAGGAPVPVPYPNISTGANANPATATKKTIVSGSPALNLGSTILISNGDEAGAQTGVVSNVVMGPTSFATGSSKLIMEGAPAVRLTSTTGQNGTNMNCPGTCIAPSQVKLLVLG